MSPIRAHHRARMAGRDPHEEHRAASPLELLFDLTFVIAFGAAASQAAHYLAEGHLASATVGFVFATVAISIAWINFSWFASAYDTDDWLYRLTTMVQMVGVLILALGIPNLFASIDHGGRLDTTVMVAGYVVMRVAMVFQWIRAARQSPDRRTSALIFTATILLAQAGWVALVIVQPPIVLRVALIVALVAVELTGPIIAESRKNGTPWHPHHIAERYGLLVIIALGEGLIGTMAALGVLVGPDGPGWSLEVAVLGLAGVALPFGMWWIYFILPCGDVLAVFRKRGFGWGYGHIILFGATVAVGAGLHVAAYYLEEHSVLNEVHTVLAVAIPVAVFVIGIFGLWTQLTRTYDSFHMVLFAGSAALIIASITLAVVGVSVVWCIAVLALTPWVTVLGYETVGHRHGAEVLERIQAEART